MVRIILAGDATFDRRMGVALTASLADVAGSVHGRGHDPFTGLTRIEAMLVLDDDTERHALDAACAGLGRFRRAAGQVGLPDWPIVDIRVTDPAAEVW